jgi:hypothetical protein
MKSAEGQRTGKELEYVIDKSAENYKPRDPKNQRTSSTSKKDI